MINPLTKILSRFGYLPQSEIDDQVKAQIDDQFQAKVDDQVRIQIKEIAPIIASALTHTTGITPDKTYAELVDAYKSWVYTAVDKIGKTIASLPVKLNTYRRNGQKIINLSSFRHELKSIHTAGKREYYLKQQGIEKREITDHPFLELIKRPNGIMTRFMLWYETMTRLELGGLCGWYIPRNNLRIPGEIWPLPLTENGQLTPKVNKKADIEYWIYKDAEINQHFKPEEIIIIKYPHPKSPFDWFSPLMAQTYPYDIDLFLEQQQRALFENRATFGNVFTTDQQLNKTQVDQLKDMIGEQFAGATKSGKALFTHSGLKLMPSTWSPKDYMIDEVARFARQKLLSSYDLSDGKVGIVEDANRANMEALDDSYILDCIKPKTMLIEEVIESFMLPIYDDGLMLDFELPDTEDKEFRLKQEESDFKNFVRTVNEIRGARGLEPKPWGDLPWMNFGLVQAGMGIPQQATETQKSYEIQTKANVWTEDKKRKKWEIQNLRRIKWETLYSQQMEGYFKAQKEEVIDRLYKYGPKYEAQYAGWSRKAVQEHIAKKGIGEDINIDKSAEIARLKLNFTPVLQSVIQNGGSDILRELGVGFIFKLDDPRVSRFLGDRMAMFSKSVTDTTFDDINAILREGFAEGKPLATIAETLREKFVSYERYRAPLIARTEVHSGLTKSEMIAIREAGIENDLLKHWLSARDDAVRDSHKEAEERYSNGIPINENFVVNGDSMDAPGQGEKPEENIGCRCDLYYSKKGT